VWGEGLWRVSVSSQRCRFSVVESTTGYSEIGLDSLKSWEHWIIIYLYIYVKYIHSLVRISNAAVSVGYHYQRYLLTPDVSFWHWRASEGHVRTAANIAKRSLTSIRTSM